MQLNFNRITNLSGHQESNLRYCDNRILLSFSHYRNLVAKEIANLISQKYKSVDIIAGVATGAIGIGLLVAEKLKLPFIYVRPESKGHG